jgi:hypothetical protein
MHSTITLMRVGALVALVLPTLAVVAQADRAPTSAPTAPSRAQPPGATPPAAPAPQQPGRSTPAPPAGQPVAQPRPVMQLAPIDLTVVPAPCKPLAKQALSSNLNAALTGRISLASCVAERAIAPLELCDCGASIVAIDKAAAPAIALLDDVIANADTALQAMAEHAEGKLYAGFVIRMLGTVPKVGPTPTEAETAMCEMRKHTLEAQLAPWREAAMASFQHVVDLVKEHPQLANNALVAPALRDSQQRLTGDVATRDVSPPR